MLRQGREQRPMLTNSSVFFVFVFVFIYLFVWRNITIKFCCCEKIWMANIYLLMTAYYQKRKRKEHHQRGFEEKRGGGRESYLTFKSPHHMRGLSEVWERKSRILLSHFLLLWNEFSSSFQPLLGEYVFKRRNVSNSAKITRPSGSCLDAEQVYITQSAIWNFYVIYNINFEIKKKFMWRLI